MNHSILEIYLFSSAPSALFYRLRDHWFVRRMARLDADTLIALYHWRALTPMRHHQRLLGLALAYAYLSALLVKNPARVAETFPCGLGWHCWFMKAAGDPAEAT